jgi:hypothetical protein
MISQALVVAKILDHLNGELTEAELVHWAEGAFVELSESDEDVSGEQVIMDTLTYIGAGDTPGFPLTWAVLSGFLEQLGTKVHVIAEKTP